MLSTIAFVTLKLFWQNSGKIAIIGAAMATSKLRNNEKLGKEDQFNFV